MDRDDARGLPPRPHDDLNAEPENSRASPSMFLAEAGQPGHIVEAGSTDQVFNAPRDRRTSDYVNGRFG